MTVRHFLEIDDLSPEELNRILDLAAEGPVPGEPRPHTIKIGEVTAEALVSRRNIATGRALEDRTVALYFEKPSLRTRHSCEAAVARLGGHPVTFTNAEVGIGTREPAADIARVLSGYHAAIGARVFDHGLLEDLAAAATVPVISLLSDLGHPCQALADLITMQAELGSLKDRTVSWVGDYNNVARSLALGAAMCGMHIRIASPPGFGPDETDVDRLRVAGAADVFVTDRPADAAKGAHAVHTDVWASMGQEDEAEERFRAFEGFQVDDDVMTAAASDAIFMHCLPAHRGEEVSASVADSAASRMIPQAHNRMHAMIGLFRWLDEVGAMNEEAQ